MNHDLEKWLQSGSEDPIEPDLPICDAHHHLWDGPGVRGQYLVDHFLKDATSGHHIVSTVFVECGSRYRNDGPEEMQPVGETEFVETLTSAIAKDPLMTPKIASAIIGFIDLTKGDGALPVIEAHLATGKGRFRGVRQSCTWDTDPTIISLAKGEGLMWEPSFREGFGFLQRYGLVFDAWQYFTQLMELADLAREYPDTTIVVNHTGGLLGTGRHKEHARAVREVWKRGMAELASCPNVMVKLGGLGMARCGFGWHEQTTPPSSIELAEVMAPYLLFCIHTFGVDRCMFESNFPVDRLSYSYGVLWNAFKRVCKGFSADELAALFHDTAARVYAL
jgi:L-fuconolactonase